MSPHLKMSPFPLIEKRELLLKKSKIITTNKFFKLKLFLLSPAQIHVCCKVKNDL